MVAVTLCGGWVRWARCLFARETAAMWGDVVRCGDARETAGCVVRGRLDSAMGGRAVGEV